MGRVEWNCALSDQPELSQKIPVFSPAVPFGGQGAIGCSGHYSLGQPIGCDSIRLWFCGPGTHGTRHLRKHWVYADWAATRRHPSQIAREFDPKEFSARYQLMSRFISEFPCRKSRCVMNSISGPNERTNRSNCLSWRGSKLAIGPL